MLGERIDPIVSWVIKQKGIFTMDMPFDVEWQRELVEKAWLLDNFLADNGVRLHVLARHYSIYMKSEYTVEAFVEVLTTGMDYTVLRRSLNVTPSDLLDGVVEAGGILPTLLPPHELLRKRATGIQGLVTRPGMDLTAFTAWLNDFLGKTGEDALSRADSSALLRAALALHGNTKAMSFDISERMAGSPKSWGIPAEGAKSAALQLVETQAFGSALQLQIWRQSGPRSYRMDAYDGVGTRLETLAETDDPSGAWYWFLGAKDALSPRQWADTIDEWLRSGGQQSGRRKFAENLERLGALYSPEIQEPLIRRALLKLHETAAWAAERIPGDDLSLEAWHPASHTRATGMPATFSGEEALRDKTRSAVQEYLPTPAAPPSLPLFRMSPIRRR